jgi:6-phosphogluconate dehydrogenase (decarboxylating)
MDMQVLIRDLQRILDAADVCLDAGNKKEAREYLREAKKLLDAEFLKD